MARIENTVFVSYRRADVYTALAVYENLKNQGYDVFFDYRSISSGDFEQIITSNIRARAHFLLILTATALDRCNEPGDWLRREIEIAIDEKRNIVPLFFKGFRFGNPSVTEKLTGKLKNLSRYNGLNVHEDYFDEAMHRLRTEYLNKPLDTVLHPVSTEVQRVVRAEQVAADKALEQIENVQQLVKQASPASAPKTVSHQPDSPQSGGLQGRKTKNLQIATALAVGIGVISLCFVATIFIYSNWPGANPDPSETSWPVTTLPAVNPEPTQTIRPENILTPTLTPEPTATGLPTPTPFPTFISSQVTLQNVPFREIDPGTNSAPYEINAIIPRLTGSDDWQVQSFNQWMSNFVTGQIDNYRQEFKSTSSVIGGTSTLDVTYVLVSQVGDVWSFRFDFPFYYAGAANTSETNMALNYDLSQGKELALSDLFISNSNYLELISDYCVNSLTNQFGTDGFFADGAKPTLENYSNWNVRSDGVLITFEKYQVAPGAAGSPEVLVPYNELESAIEPEGPLLFLYR